MTVEYIHLVPDTVPPAISSEYRYRAVVISECDVSPEWRAAISDWLVRTGCLYMIAWGLNCSLWDDSVDFANLEKFSYGEIPEESFVMTTWHDKESLEEALWFAKHCGSHPSVALNHTLLVHVSCISKSHELLSAYADA